MNLKKARFTQTKPSQWRIRWITLLVLSIVALLMAQMYFAMPTGVNAQAGPIEPKDQLKNAWELARAFGSYSFDADITQIQRPLVTVTNVGKSTIRDNFYLQGATNLSEQTLEMTIWTQGGTVLDKNTGAQIRIEGDKAYARQGDQPWQEINNFTGLFAPNNDFMAYLVAAVNVQNLGQETRAGIEFTRISFDIDGLAYATYMRDQMQVDMARRGELLAGSELALPGLYKDMTGHGELWLDADGLPLRQILQLDFPPEDEQQISAEVAVNFSHFIPAEATLPSDSAAAKALNSLTPILPGSVTPEKIFTTSQQVTSISVPVLIAAMLMALVVLTLIYSHRSRTVLAALQLSLILAIVTGPLLRSTHAQQIFHRHQARTAASNARGQESEMSAALNAGMAGETAVSPGTVNDILNDPGIDSDNDGFTDVEEGFLGTNPFINPEINSTLPALDLALNTPADPLPADDGKDTDGDGLTDYVEALLGTAYDTEGSEDTDGDGISDYDELMGFTAFGVNWVTDPLEMDTNRDGINDGLEWTINASGGIPADSDGDNVPDLFDNDNDGDGVPDNLDLSPYTFDETQIFDGDNPFSLVLNGLEEDKITYVEFQLRPVVEDHLRYTYNIFDWPDDKRGNIQDGNSSKEDITLTPMLELTIPDTASHMLDEDLLQQYNIFPQDLPGDNQALYLPLNLTLENRGSRAVAFEGKMIYTDAVDWGDAHQVRLVWMVQLKNDVCSTFNDAGICTAWSSFDEPQVIHTYEDSWQLTGLNVRENHWTEIATLYEDPDIDQDLNDDTELWKLSYGLDLTYMAGGLVSDSNGTRLWDVAEINRRFNHATNGGVDEEQRWSIDNTLSVSTAAYTHLDEALITTVQTTTLGILDTHFSHHWSSSNPINPTLLFARQDKYRSFNLDETAETTVSWGQTTQDANELTLNIPTTAVPVEIASSINWAPFLYDEFEASWKSHPIELYWEYLGDQISDEMLAQYIDPEVAGGATFLAQLYYMSLANGLHSIVKIDEERLERAFITDDKPLGFKIGKGAGTVGVALITDFLTDHIDESTRYMSVVFRNLIDPKLYPSANPVGGGIGALKNLVTAIKALKGVQFGLAFAGVFLLTAAILVGVGFLINDWLGSGGPSKAGRITTAVLVGAVMTYASVVAPLLQARNLVNLTGISITKALTALESVSKGAKVAAVIGLVIAVSISWGIFIYAVTNGGGIAPGSVAFNTLLAQTIAATIIAIIQFAISLTIIGAIFLAIFALVDILFFILADFSINNWLTEQLGKAIYHFELTIESDIETGDPDLALVEPNRGMVDGAIMAVSMPVTTTIHHTNPDSVRVIPYLPLFYTRSNLRSTTFQYTLSPEEAPFDSDRDDMRGEWESVGVHHTYLDWKMQQGTNSVTPSTNVTLTTGINRALPLYLNNSYALPGVDCWTIPIPIPPYVAPYCEDHTIDGEGSSDIGSSLILDVLPATLDEFAALNWGRQVPFPTQNDHDNDGLISRELFGNDPDDFDWDSDNDGLSDAYEIVRREEGFGLDPDNPDSDFDGLSDYDEMRFGTDPGFPDTDRDGLADSEEVWHFDLNSQQWEGGWLFTAVYTDTQNAPNQTLSVRIFSDPLKADADEDGIGDGLERDLHLLDPEKYPYHPNNFNESPVPLYITFDDDDRFVSPNQTVTISATVRNNLSDPFFANGSQTLTLPAELGGTEHTNAFNILQGQTNSIVVTTDVSAGTSGPLTLSAESLALLHDGDLSWSYEWISGSSDTRTLIGGINRIFHAQLAANPAGSSDFAIISIEDKVFGDVLGVKYTALDIFADGNVMVGSASTSISDPFPREKANPDSYHDTKIGNSRPAIACNSDGQCVEAYVEIEWIINCADVYLDDIWVRNESDAGNKGEYYLKLDGDKIWGPKSGGNGQFLEINKTVEICQGQKLVAWEDDDWPNGDDKVGTLEFDATILEAPHEATKTYGSAGNDHLDLHYYVLPTNVNRYAATRFLTSTLTILPTNNIFRVRFPDGVIQLSDSAQPAIATSGNNWLVGFQTRDTPTELFTQIITSPNSGGTAQRLDQDNSLTGKDDQNLTLVWAGTQYLAVWESTFTATDHDIKMAFINSNGSVTLRKNVDFSGSNETSPSIAYSPFVNKSLVVYKSGTNIVGRFIEGTSVGNRFVIESAISSATLRNPNVVYDEFNNVWIVSWENRAGGNKAVHVALSPDTAERVTDQPHTVTLPAGYNHDLACVPPLPDDLPINPNLSQFTKCAIVASAGASGDFSMQLDNFRLESTPPWIGGGATFTGTASETLIVDNDLPTATITSFDDGQSAAVSDSFIIGGDATDATSNIALVEVNVDGSWQSATGTESWSFAWNVPNSDSSQTIKVRATDAVGHVGPETSVTITLDRQGPTTTVTGTPNAFLTPTVDENGRYHLTFSGSVSDASSNVSAVRAFVSPGGDGEQTAELNGNSWTLDYIMSEFDENGNRLVNPTGDFTLTVLAEDALGNVTDSSSYASHPFRLDTTPPEATLIDYGPSIGVISGTLTLTGVITDPGALSVGIQQLEIDFVPTGETTESWTAVTLADSGPGVANSSWSYPIPNDLEGNFLINLRGTDELGNQSPIINWFSGWQGEIDTWAPRVEFTATHLNEGTAAITKIEATITDRNLTREGLQFPCADRLADRGFGSDPFLDSLGAGQNRLTSLTLACHLNGHTADPVTLRVFDLYGHETTQTIIASPSGGAPLSQGLQTVDVSTQAVAASSVLAGTVLTPTHRSAITDISTPVTIEGGAYGINGIKTITLTINGTFHEAIQIAASPVVTDTVWSMTWTPPAEGSYELVTIVEDWAGGIETDQNPATVIVDTTPPTVTLDTTALSDAQQLTTGRFELTGTAADNLSLEDVTVSIDGGPAQSADLNGTNWRFVWTPLTEPDGESHSIVVTASDAGNETSSSSTLEIDVVPPQDMTVTAGYTDGGAPMPVNPGDTVRAPAVTGLTTEWTAATDGGGVAEYLVGWTNSPTPTLSALTSYPDATSTHTTAVTEATIWFGHTAVLDTAGNTTVETIGPVIIDAPTTPDYINPADGINGIYRGWMESGCSLMGADYEVARYAPDGASLNSIQQFYTTWDATHLRLAWTGADWRVDGDLFIYLDTISGGATTAYNPYGAGAAIALPDEGSGQLGADYLIFIEDGSDASLLSWNGSNWMIDQSLTSPNFLFDPDGATEHTDLYLPFSWLGSPTTLKLAAVASDEDALRLWAAMPDHNPLNSRRAVDPTAVTTLDLPFALTQHYEWTGVGTTGICPAANQFEQADLHFDLVSDPGGVSVGFLQHDLAGLTQPNSALDGDLDGVIDVALPLDSDPVPVGNGQVINYTLHYENSGTADATGVVADITALGGLSNLSDMSLALGTLAAGSTGSVSFTAVVDSALDGQSAEIRVQVDDAVHAPFEWLWQQHDIDSVAPTDVTIVSPAAYIGANISTIRGVVTDVSDVPDITLRANGSTQNCTDPTPNDGAWSCLFDAGGAADGSTFQIDARGTDKWNNTGNFGPAVTLTVDTNPPTISLSAESVTALSDGRLTADDLPLSGTVTDDRSAAGAEICALSDGDSDSLCVKVLVNPAGQPTAAWRSDVPLFGSADGESYSLSFYGIDSAGNRTTIPNTHIATVDFTGPTIQITTQPTTVAQYSTEVALAGTISDGSGITRFIMQETRPDNNDGILNEFITHDLGTGPNWSQSITFNRVGIYQVGLVAEDGAGNKTILGAFRIEVIDSGVNVPPTADTGGPYEVPEGETVTLEGSVDDVNLITGQTLTYAWDLDDDGTFETADTLTPQFDATNIDGPAERTVHLQVSDGEFTVTDSTTVLIRNLTPSADAGGPYSVNEGELLTMTGSGEDPYPDDTVTLSWDLNNDGLFDDATGNTAVLDATNIDGPISGSIHLKVTDDDGDFSIATAAYSVLNVDPTLADLTITNVPENGIATLSGTIGDASPLDSFELAIDWGDGSTAVGYVYPAGTTTFTETHQYLDDNPSGTAVDDYTVSLSLLDDDDGIAEDSTTVTVTNLEPTLADVAITDVDEAGVATLTGSLADVGSEDSFTLGVDWGDGSAVSTFNYPAGTAIFTETHRYLDDNPSGTAVDNYTVNLTLTDDDTGSAADSATVTVTNLDPALANVTITDVNEGDLATLAGEIIEVGTEDSLTLIVDWGDGTAVDSYSYAAGTTTFSEIHLFVDDDTSGTAVDIYTVNLTLIDDDTGTTVENLDVTITNVDPALSNIAVTHIDENGTATLTGTITDVGTADSFTLDVDWGDGTAVDTFTYRAGTTTFSETHQYIDDNPTGTPQDDYTINLTLTDDDTGTISASLDVTVTNLPPTLSNIAITDVNEDGIATLSGNLADGGTEDSFTLEVDWGDGSLPSSYSYPAGTTSFSETHTYLDDNPDGTAADDYTVTLSLTDDDTGSTQDSTVVTVSNVAPVLSTDVPTQTVQYSDGITDITITGTDVADDPLQVSTSWSVDGGAFVTGLPDGMSLATNTCLFSGNGRTCSWTISGIADAIAGSYVLRVTIEDDDLGQTEIDQVVEILPEDSVAVLDPTNRVVIPVTAPGSNASEDFTLLATVEELEPDMAAYQAAAGDINNAQLSITLAPVGSGSSVTVSCTPTPVDPVTGYADVMGVSCDFTAVPVNAYTVHLVVDGGFYTSDGDEYILAVYDPTGGIDGGAHAAALEFCMVSDDKEVKLHPLAVTDCDILASGAAEVDLNGFVDGEIISFKEIILQENATVTGDAVTAGTVTLMSGAVVNGTIEEGAVVYQPVLPVLSITAGGSDVTVAKNSTLDLAPGSYGSLEVKDGAVLNLNSGTYAFENIEFDKNASLNLDTSNGPIVIGSMGDLSTGKDVVMSSSGTADEIVFQVAGNSVSLSAGTVFLGSVVAPNAFIDVHNDVLVTGALYGDKIHLKENSVITGRPAVQIYFDLYIAPVFGG